MSLVADGVLIATCLTTAIYCVMLSRRLKRLSATDDGIGQQILRLNQVLDETKAAVAEIQGTTRSASEELAADIDAARRLGEQLQRQIARAMKSGVGRHEPEQAAARIIAGPSVAGDTVAGDNVPVADAAADEEPAHAMAEAAPVVDFEAAEEIDRPEADSLAAEAGDEQDDHAFEEERMDADEDSTGTSDDIAEASDHWPFDESGEAMASDEELAESAGEEEEPLASETPPGDGREGAAGLLRVERMAV